MPFNVRFEPSGHTIVASGSASLLRAALREGLNLDHNCANGSCGRCLGRLLSGELTRLRNHDYVLGEAERATGRFLMCCHAPAADLVVEAHEVHSAAEIPRQTLVARVSRLERLRDDVMQLTLRTPRSQGLHFLAGQSVTLALPGLPPTEVPVASCPCDAIQLRFHVRRRPGDVFSRAVFGHLGKGDAVGVEGPAGDFILDEDSDRPVIFVAWESGFAPIASLMDHLIQLDAERPIFLYWLSAHPEGHYLANQCRAWRDALDNFSYRLMHLHGDQPCALRDAVTAIARAHAPVTRFDVYLAMPADAEALIRDCLAATAMPDHQVHLTLLQHP